MIKATLRKVYQEKRQMLDTTEYQVLNDLLCENFFKRVDLSGVKLLHTFLPVAHNKEPDTWLIIHRTRQNHPNIRIAVPRISGDGQTLDTVMMDQDSAMQPNRWGISEPIGGLTIDPIEIDVVLVPLLAFDMTGNRVGYGKGFYDKFLPRCKPGCRRIGVSFFEPVNKISDTDAFDQRLTAALTPHDWFVFS
jgi:5-formyltetrahydrofolate cyclo-ligase